jgi:hypothetical protein
MVIKAAKGLEEIKVNRRDESTIQSLPTLSRVAVNNHKMGTKKEKEGTR